MKKRIALFLAAALALTSTAGCSVQRSGVGDKVDILIDGNADTSSGEIGRVVLSVDGNPFLEKNVDFKASISNGKGFESSKTVSASGASREKISFDRLADGDYTLSVTADGFADYKQTVSVLKNCCTVKLAIGFNEGYTYEKGGLHPGVLLNGDTDGNGTVDAADKDILIDCIDGKEASEKYFADINGDGSVDIIDLALFAKSFGDARDTLAAIEKTISPFIIDVTPAEGTKLEGSAEELIKGTGGVALSPVSGEISEENPVALGFDFSGSGSAVIANGIVIGTDSENLIDKAVVAISYEEDGKEYNIDVPLTSGVEYLLEESDVHAVREDDGTINVYLGDQVAVKKVTINITAMSNDNNLAEISTVEFVNGMENRIPAPETDIPEGLAAKAGSESFDLSWTPCVNITGYEVKVQLGDVSETFLTTVPYASVTSFGGKGVKNYTTYKVSVQSINGAWSSGYCEPVEVTPKPTGPPDKPDMVTAVGKYKSILVSWKDMDDTQSYKLFYRVRNSGSEFEMISGIAENKYTITGLEDLTEYEIYVVGVNEFGDSPESIHCAASTTNLDPAEMPKYELINRDENGIPGISHITAAERIGASMVDSPLDEGKEGTAWGAVDNNAASYYSKPTWDDGGFNNIGNNGLFFTFDKAYKLDTIALLPTDGMQYSYAKVKYWNEKGEAAVVQASVIQQKDANGKTYYMLKLPEAVTAAKIQIGLARYLATSAYQLITVAEVYFYHYDELRDEIMALYTDDLHTVLRDDVTQKDIDELRARVNAPDEFGEINPNLKSLLAELDTAEKILNDEKIGGVTEVHNDITTNDVGRGFGGLNAWQPLGAVAAAGDKITVYVGHNTGKTGDNAALQLVAAQYHAEAAGVAKVVANLKVGANEITVPALNSSIDAETGGALYVQYTGKNQNDRYAVRVSGAASVPVLDLYNVEDENERTDRAVEYIKALEEYTAQMKQLHNDIHKNSGNKYSDLEYDETNCILGASDIMLNTMMLSLPASRIIAGVGSGTAEKKAETLLASLQSMEDMMYLFYQHKGLNESAPDAVNQVPKGHLNIRYQRMFSGAFMYASGNHIGIEWGSASGMVNCTPVVADESGKYLSGRYFGWGIAHEIGHCINQGSYAVAEVTNNYFAVLAQAKDNNNSVRFIYDNVFDKVTSGAKGSASNVFTQLGMYWQLHLAYDKGYNYKTYSDYEEQLDNLFFARVDTYSRTPASAPALGGVALTLSGGSDQVLMRLSCAAAEKDILEFFRRWGKEPDADTVAYAEQFEKETRAIFFANDDSRVYALEGSGSSLKTDSTSEAIGTVNIGIGSSANVVELSFDSVNIPKSDVLGYEITRCTISGGRVEEVPVGFTRGTSFTDTVNSMNNRTVFYKITLIDNYLNRSASVTSNTVKIQHEGYLDKSNWSISAEGLLAKGEVHEADENMPCEETEDNPALKAIDGDNSTLYAPEVTADNAELVIGFNKLQTVSGIKITSGVGSDYEAYVLDGGEWRLAAEGKLSDSGIVYFANDDSLYVASYSTDSVKVVIKGQNGSKISIGELDIVGVTGDNVDFRRDDTGSAAIGLLGSDYKYGTNETDIIPAGSLVFTGSYKGNPAYNIVLLYDNKGNIVGGIDGEGNIKAQQIILADVPEKGNIANVSNGTWIYWIEPNELSQMTVPAAVRAELYRVNNALTNEGQRLVSDSMLETVPDTLPTINFGE